MTAKVLGGGVHHDIRSKLKRSLQTRRGKCVVDHQKEVPVLFQCCHRLYIGDAHHGVGRGFHPDHTCSFRDRRFEFALGSEINKGELDAIALEDLCEEPVGSAVKVVGGNHLISRSQKAYNGIDSSQTAAEGQTEAPVFYGGQVAFQRRTGRIVRAGIFIALVLTWAGLRIGRCQIDGGHHCTEGGVGLLTAVYGLGAEA